MTSIITGDIINSRKTTTQNWLVPLKKIFSKLNTGEIFRGDSFQVEVNNIEETFLIALIIKSTIKINKSVDVRMAIGIGNKEYDAGNIKESSGEAYINSGKAFDSLKKQTLTIKSPWKELDEELNLALELGLLTMDNWTPNSAEFVKTSLNHLDATQKQLSEILQISQSSVSERRKRSGLNEILKLEKRYRKLVSSKLTR